MSTERREPDEGELLPPPEEDWDPPLDPSQGGTYGGVPRRRPAQPMRQLDSEDGPPPRRGGPTG
jgi:hypothetical protein